VVAVVSDLVNISAYLSLMAEKQPHKPEVSFPTGRDKNGRDRLGVWASRKLAKERTQKKA